jgi:preprotein translocase subunit SecA
MGNEKRAVMVFFRTKQGMHEFLESPFMKSLRQETQLISEEASKEEREGLFNKATESGAITLMIREFGRGTDFKCYDQKMLQIGGVHVIQAFFSTDAAEDRQIKGRSARQGRNGSYR